MTGLSRVNSMGRDPAPQPHVAGIKLFKLTRPVAPGLSGTFPGYVSGIRVLGILIDPSFLTIPAITSAVQTAIPHFVDVRDVPCHLQIGSGWLSPDQCLRPDRVEYNNVKTTYPLRNLHGSCPNHCHLSLRLLCQPTHSRRAGRGSSIQPRWLWGSGL